MHRRHILPLALLAALLTGCQLVSPTAAPQTAPTQPVLPSPVSSPTSLPPTAAPTPTATSAPTSSPTPAPTASPTAAPVTEAWVKDRYPMQIDDGLGYGMALIAGGGRLWEVTSGGTLRVYDARSHEVIDRVTLDEEMPSFSFVSLALDAKYVWLMFYDVGEDAPASLYRVTQADNTVRAVALPETCGSYGCSFHALYAGEGLVWLGGFGWLEALDPDTLEPRVECDLVEKTQSFKPFAVDDIDAPGGGKIWLLMSADVPFVSILDVQDLLAGGSQEPEYIDFTIDTSPEWIASAGGKMWAGLSKNENTEEQKQAQLLALTKTGVEMGLNDSLRLPDALDLGFLPYGSHASDGRYLWLLDGSMKRIFSIDPHSGEVAQVLEVYTGEAAKQDDPHILFGMSFDGTDLWLFGVETIRVALP